MSAAEERELARYVRYGQRAVELLSPTEDPDVWASDTDRLLEAQAYATLALAAATAWGVTRRTSPWAEKAVVDASIEELARQGAETDAARREASRG